MTDKDKLEKVRAEVERRLRLLVPKITFLHQRKELENILSFIDSLQEESKKEVGDIHSCDPHFGVNIEEYKDPNFGDRNGRISEEEKQVNARIKQAMGGWTPMNDY